MAGKTVNPTRMELTRLKGRLKTARRGHKLLKDKRDELMKQFLEIVRRNRQLRAKVEQGLKEATAAFTVAAVLNAESPTLLMNAMFALAGIAWATINVNSFPMVVELASGGDVGKYTGYY